MKLHRVHSICGVAYLYARGICITFCTVFVLVHACDQAYAQEKIPRPTVTRAFDVIDPYPERVAVGTDIIFKRKASIGAQNLLQSGLQVRIFTLRDDETGPVPLTVIDDCDVYLSVVNKIEPTLSTDVRFVKIDRAWLNLTNSLNSIKDGRYYFVLEQAGPLTKQFRIKSSDAKSYFSTGFRVEVYDNGSVTFDEVKLEYFKRRESHGKLLEEVDKNNSEVPCYTYRKLVAETEAELQVAQGSLELCYLSDSLERAMRRLSPPSRG